MNAVLDEILQRHAVWRGGVPALGVCAVPSGFAALDAELPGGGWPRQGLIELLVDQAGIGELGILIAVLARLTSAGKHAVLVALPYLPYAPAWAASRQYSPVLAPISRTLFALVLPRTRSTNSRL